MINGLFSYDWNINPWYANIFLKGSGYSIMPNGGDFNNVGHYHMLFSRDTMVMALDGLMEMKKTGIIMRLSKTCADIKCAISKLKR